MTSVFQKNRRKNTYPILYLPAVRPLLLQVRRILSSHRSVSIVSGYWFGLGLENKPDPPYLLTLILYIICHRFLSPHRFSRRGRGAARLPHRIFYSPRFSRGESQSVYSKSNLNRPLSFPPKNLKHHLYKFPLPILLFHFLFFYVLLVLFHISNFFLLWFCR